MEVLTELRGGSELPPCPVVVLTGSNVRVGSSVLRAGAQDYIGKSWSTRESLTRAIENAIERFELIAERSRAERKLRESEARIRLAAQVSGFGIYDYDVAADICNWSPELFALTGVPGDEIIRMATVTRLMHPDDRERFMLGMQASLNPVAGIAMSGYGMNEDRRRSREAGFSEHLVKPIDVPQLIAAIHRVTDNRGSFWPWIRHSFRFLNRDQQQQRRDARNDGDGSSGDNVRERPQLVRV
jgi:CheY-like chemotaxis protein